MPDFSFITYIIIFSDQVKGLLDLVDAAGVSAGVRLPVPRCDCFLGGVRRYSLTVLSRFEVRVVVGTDRALSELGQVVEQGLSQGMS